MGNSIVYTQLHHLGIHHNQLHILRAGFVYNTHNQRIDAYGFTGSGCTCNQQMGHFRNICNHHLAADILSHSKSQTGTVIFKIVRFQKLS